MPHIHCYIGQSSLIWTMFTTDLLIGSAYLIIAVMLCALVKRLNIPFSAVVICFGAFIGACGLTHFLEVWTLWRPDYWVSAWVKMITAATSVGTAIYLYRLRGTISKVVAASSLAEDQRLRLEQLNHDLTARENTLRSFYDSAPMMMGIADLEGDSIRHISDNLAAARFFELPDAAMRGKLASELGVPRDGHELWVKSYKKAALSGDPVRFEYMHSHHTGLRCLFVTVSLIGQTAQGVPRFSYIVQDVTDMRQAETEILESRRLLETRVDERTAELRASEQKFAKMFEIAPFPFALVRMPGGAVADVNSAWINLFGYSKQEIVGKTSLDLPMYVNEEDRLRVYGEFARMGYVRNVETTIITKVGEHRHVRNNMDLLEIEGETYVLGTLEDITEQKRAKEAIEERQQTLMSVILNSPSVLSLKSRDGRYFIANPNYDRILGISAETILGLSDLDIFSEEIASQLMKNDREVFESLESRVIEETIPAANGSNRLFVSNKFPIFNSKNEAQYVCSISLDVTEMRRFQEELKASRAQLEAAFQAMSDGIMVFDMVGKVLLLNEAEARICGYASVQEMQQDLEYFSNTFELTDLDGSPIPLEQWPVSRVMRGESLPLTELRGRRKDTGQEWVFAYSGEPVFDDHDQQSLTVIVTRDITRSKRAEEQLRESEERFRTITNNAASCLFMMDKKGHPTFMNPAAMQVTGYGSLLEINNRPLHYAVHWKKADGSDYPIEECPIDHAQAVLKAAQNQEELFCRKDGSLFPVSYSIAPLEKNGEVVGSVLEFRDITQVKQAETALRESEIRYRILADTVPHMVFTNNARGDITYFNYQWMLYTGQSLEWLLERAFDIIHPDDGEGLKYGRDQAIAQGIPHAAEVRLRDGQGFYKWHSLKMVPLRDGQGEILAWYGAAVNIEDQKQAQEILRNAKDQLENEVRNRTEQLRIANQELESFSYSVSHDLRAPLRSINGFSNRLMRRAAQLEPADLQDLERIRTASVRMGHLIDDLLKLARVSRAELHFKKVDLSRLAHEVVEELRECEPERARIEVRISPDLDSYGDANLLRQVLQNLIGNAWKFTRHQEHALIEVKGVHDGEHSLITIEDNGAGFSMEYAGQLFVPFQRLHAAEEFEGTGIGLATVRRILHKHGGEIWAEAEPGKGAKFSFKLPFDGST